MGSLPAPVKPEYRILDKPSRSGRKLRIVCLGGGASALNLAHEMDTCKTLDLELVCYEKNPSIGGTWYENRYPGCGCDIPSVNYQFSWAPSPDWTQFYSGAPEILKYFKDVAEKYDLNKYIRLNHTVVGALWDEREHMWTVEVQRQDGSVFQDKAHVFVNASGVLNKWKWPAIKGRETFKGKMLHSANWDDSIHLKGQRVGVIGSGSSAVQIVPNIQPLVGSLSCFIRSSSWVVGGFGQRFAGKKGSNFKYSEEQHEILKNDPKKYLAYRKKIESELNSRFRFILNGSKEQQDARDFADKDMRSKLAGRPDLQDVIIPKNFAVGCRRPTPGNGYLEALCEDNVTVVSSSIREITPNGIRTADGTEHELDVIVCATGFDVSWRPRYPTIGRNGVSLSEYWKDVPNTYLSLAVANMPNYVIFNGPFGPYGHGSFLPITEAVARYVMQMLRKMSEEEIASFCPKQDAVDDFAEHRRKFLPRTAWTSPCRSWFKQGTVDGEPMMWPGSRIQFFETIAAPRWEDFDLAYTTSNRFGYWGNGFAARETDGRDLTWYLGLLDGLDEQPALPDEEFEEFIMNR
ncbi:FAD-binding monooxygenase moxY [Colletotrichum trifolii]|uniref:FAD-binding monooxygenase moxY n=1 Tax=Colletotrichum trifolii TaxID=5466 RepID=A0A4R8QHC6_COLTR|nr:FAD-binding monooxygenase moxY [Colletotrichum trifolii]